MSDINTAKGPNVLMILSSVFMTFGSLITGSILMWERAFMLHNHIFLTGSDMVTAFLALVLIILEVIYIISVLLTRLKMMHYKGLTIKKLAVAMLILNIILFIHCFICFAYLDNWVPEGYFTLADILILFTVPGIIVKILALIGASRSAK
ncbi:MAG: hypothetical protein IJH64_08530 [Oscillospiraceae bacterium]|nr:hypothetical protein [Oscillospiraceae bacterium]